MFTDDKKCYNLHTVKKEQLKNMMKIMFSFIFLFMKSSDRKESKSNSPSKFSFLSFDLLSSYKSGSFSSLPPYQFPFLTFDLLSSIITSSIYTHVLFFLTLNTHFFHFISSPHIDLDC
ncbi:hypothetical protein U1Q18_052790 [Sarracenia purpurea var. burkii]